MMEIGKGAWLSAGGRAGHDGGGGGSWVMCRAVPAAASRRRWGMGEWRAVAQCLGCRVRRRPELSLDPASHCLFGISAPSPRQGTASYRRGWQGPT
jgi:hypothetical protein